MRNLSTTYMGLDLPNPIMVSSCSLSRDIDGVGKIADAGAGGLVLKSLFEEQMDLETREIEQHIGPSWHTEAADYVRNMGMHLGPQEYLKLIADAKNAITIPVIASLNCVSVSWWTDYARKLEVAGADAIELNIAYLPSQTSVNGRQVETVYGEIVRKVIDQVKIPVAVKIGSSFSSLAAFAQDLVRTGVRGLTLFNRFYQVDIDIDKIELKPGYTFSAPEEMSLPLRWIALLSGQLDCDFSATTGVHDGAGAVKLLLAGAQTVQLCSVLYQNDLGKIGQILHDIDVWMDQHGFDSVEAFRGKLNAEHLDKPELWERLQYIKALVGIE